MINHVLISKWIFSLTVLFVSYSLFGQSETDKYCVRAESRITKEQITNLQHRAQVAAEAFPQYEEQNGEQPLDEDQIMMHGLCRSNPLFEVHHHYFGISLLSDDIELEDGSVWAIDEWDSYKTDFWHPSHRLLISPNLNLFSSYRFRITNLDVGNSIQVNLSFNPLLESPNRRWIREITWDGFVILDDRSVWEMSPYDIEDWRIEDTIIVGNNDGWFWCSPPNILFNVSIMDCKPCEISY